MRCHFEKFLIFKTQQLVIFLKNRVPGTFSTEYKNGSNTNILRDEIAGEPEPGDWDAALGEPRQHWLSFAKGHCRLQN